MSQPTTPLQCLAFGAGVPPLVELGFIGDTYKYLSPPGALVAILLLIHSIHLPSWEVKLLAFISYLSAPSPDLEFLPKKDIL